MHVNCLSDIQQDWAVEFKGWDICRIDGSTSQQDRRSQMDDFNNGTGEDACKLFLLSTRAGGLGVNLVAAEYVYCFAYSRANDAAPSSSSTKIGVSLVENVVVHHLHTDPQMDLQAQDRAHRIGQKKPVLIYRLVSAHTIETKILQRAGNKRKLEALVISQGKFGRVVDENGRVLLGKTKPKAETISDMAKELLSLEGEEINVASADDTIIR